MVKKKQKTLENYKTMTKSLGPLHIVKEDLKIIEEIHPSTAKHQTLLFLRDSVAVTSCIFHSSANNFNCKVTVIPFKFMFIVHKNNFLD
jgi:hypothetical protein